jgi:hypothetical protein
MQTLLEERIQQMKGSQGSEFPDDIRRLLRTRLTSTRCSADVNQHRTRTLEPTAVMHMTAPANS